MPSTYRRMLDDKMINKMITKVAKMDGHSDCLEVIIPNVMLLVKFAFFIRAETLTCRSIPCQPLTV